MKLNGTFVIRSIAGETVIVPVGETALRYNGMITTTETGEVIWKMLENDVTEEEIVDALMEQFEADRETIAGDVQEFLEQLRKMNLLN